jgi:transcription-repair coupling factor (superfamily II helicase)
MPVWLSEALKENKAVKLLDAGKGPLPQTSFIEEALVICTSYRKKPRPILVIKQNLYNAQRLYERVSTLLEESECALFSADESLRVETIAASPEMTAIKVETMASLLENPNQVVITCPSALLRHLPSPEHFQDGCISLHNNDEMDIEELKRRLTAGGYTQTSHVDQPLSYAARGGIVDIYSINYDSPIRVEFFDTEIDSIRFFDVLTQKTVETVDEVHIVPASDVIFTDDEIKEIQEKAETMTHGEMPSEIESDLMSLESHVFDRSMYPYMSLLDHTAGIWDYMHDPLLIWCDEQSIHDNAKHFTEDTIAYVQEMVQEGKMLPKYAIYHDIQHIPSKKQIYEDPFIDNISHISEVNLPNEVLAMKLKMMHVNTRNVLALPDHEMKKVMDACIESQTPYKLLVGEEAPEKGINLWMSDLNQGFSLDDEDITVYTASELFEIHHHKGRYENKFRNAEVIHAYDELEPGDYIVHATYGVGQYLGIETREIQGVKRDFLKCVYRGNAELLVPLEQFRLVRKFVSREGVVPRLNKLGSGDWEKTKKKLQENVEDIAARLIALYSNREEHIGHAFGPDTELSRKFENEFDYELTPDQKQAVVEIKKDMESTKPMDRLVCGDVGFGKTEVAVIASFKAVSDGMQVAVLCPTTILAEQHFHTFMQRYEGYPVTIKVLDRFVPDSEVTKTLKDLKEGNVDILIGTHRLLSRDVVFKNLGLLVVDEEQRFGVEHKERIKEIKNGIDVLTLSATPIPRTLQMSLVGIRQLSQLETPPMNRYSVQTYVVEKNKGLVIDAIQKELSRAGQVFYLYNNIEQIYNVARTLQNDLPEAQIGVVHGQMNRDEIEDTMMRFNNHEIDVLVCTTIVENGIDVPNANTILIENAQDFGLAQIYQIKGRVGRSNRLAYAYLMIPPRKQLSEVAQKRLQAVKEFARLGSGYKIAMRDLTIRGAGDLLGPSQSGFIDTVGIDMYIEMLEEAIEAKKSGREVRPVINETHAPNIKKTSYIPKEFAPDDFDKLAMYQKIDEAVNANDLNEYKKTVVDQFGRLPNEVNALFMKKQLDLLLSDPDIESYRELKSRNEITFSSLFSEKVDGIKLFEDFTKISKDAALRYTNNMIIVTFPKGKDDLELAIALIHQAKEDVKDENR